jgi:hypothetical protein
MNLHGVTRYCISQTFYLSILTFLKVELTLVRFDHQNKKIQLLLKGHQLIPILHELNEKIEDE